MPKRPELTSTVIFVDGEPFLISHKVKKGFVARRLRGKERAVAMKLLDDAHAEVAARLGRAPDEPL